ncbi:NAD(+)--rifampin ADP-ribosyltransferase [Brevundimonas sp.]|uniref:NAD(+)--rifampin ADP-ribosyltransferase n=1 Tax=Brevundimonas sp. TaxID=1871086 RepID=UPI0035B05524
MTAAATPFAAAFFHGTRAALAPGDHVEAGRASNYGARKAAGWVYVSATMDAAVWGAELAVGEGPERIYVVEPTGALEDDPNLTDQRFPGNPSRSYRTREPLRVLGEVVGWVGHPPAQVARMKAGVAELEARGIGAIED